MKLEFSRKIFVKYSNIKFHENLSSWNSAVPCGETNMTKPIVAFRNFANAPKTSHVLLLIITPYRQNALAFVQYNCWFMRTLYFLWLWRTFVLTAAWNRLLCIPSATAWIFWMSALLNIIWVKLVSCLNATYQVRIVSRHGWTCTRRPSCTPDTLNWLDLVFATELTWGDMRLSIYNFLLSLLNRSDTLIVRD
jgi:hypothetical protein